jgi:GntR family transcriptional regulator
MYVQIADALRDRIHSGEFERGQVLPTEIELGHAYGSSRLTIRRSLAILRDEGLLQSRRGFGWFVATRPLEHRLSWLGTIEQQIERTGRVPLRQVRHFGFEAASGAAREVLGVDEVLRIARLNRAEHEVIAHSTAWVPAVLAAGLTLDQVSNASLYDLLPVEIGGAKQRISAVAAAEEDAELLGLPIGAPCLRSERTAFSLDGSAAVYAVAIFAAHRTEFVVELPRGEQPSASVQLADGAGTDATPR